MPELEGFDEFDNDLVTSEVLSLEALIDSQSASKEREIDEEDEIASPAITMPRVCDVLDALRTIRTFFSCTPEVDDATFKHINTLENSVFNQSLRCLTQKHMDDYLKPGPTK